jgi:hypothetical protein
MNGHDERIAAWLDGTLGLEESAAFEAEMDRDPALAEQVANWQANDDLLRAAYNAPIEQGVDDALLTRMGLSAPAAANDNPERWPIRRRWALPLGGALAASIALAIMLTGNPPSPGPAGNSATEFAMALDRLPARSTATLADGAKVSPVLSFVAADGRYCREFAVTGGASPGGGIACKGASGWTIEALSAAGAAPADPDRIVMAGGSSESPLDSAYARLGASDPLSADAERQLIASEWKQLPQTR